MALSAEGSQGGPRSTGGAIVRAYAQILFSRSPAVGALLLLATFTQPAVGAAGATSALLALAFARALGLPPDAVATGAYGYNALLVGLGVGAWLEPGPGAALLLAAGVALTVLLTAAAHGAITSTLDLPVLTVPFFIGFELVLGAAARLELPRVPVDLAAATPILPAWAHGALTSLGALFFVPSPLAGTIVLAALVVHTRIGALLVAQGLVVAWALARLGPPSQTAALQTALGYNLALIALGVGGLWFVPSRSSFLLALGAALVGGVVTIGALPVLDWLGLPLLVLPFNVVAAAVLLATRQRLRDVAPRSAPLLSATPEENLAAHRARAGRLGASHAARTRAPFHGRWTCTQGVNGPHTHRGQWAQAADFEVLGPEGRAHRGAGARREDYLCYHLPIVAPADATVALVRDGVPDNPIGEVNVRENWGNLVVLHHGPGLYSLLAHLSPHTIKVREGQRVRQGEPLALCGSSGRSPTPHLHMQLQATPRPGAPTLPFELNDVVLVGAPEVLRGVLVPAPGQVVRNLEPDQELERRLRFDPGTRLAFRVLDERGEAVELLSSELDLYGARRLRSETCSAALDYEVTEGLFTVLASVGPRRSVVHLLRAALGRVPLETTPGLTWTDRLEHSALLKGAPARWLLDSLGPFLPDDRLVMSYALTSEAGDLVITGASDRVDGHGRPRVSTRCVLRNGEGPVDVRVTLDGRERRALRAPLPAACPAAPVVVAALEADA